jgi:hypothetical protein
MKLQQMKLRPGCQRRWPHARIAGPSGRRGQVVQRVASPAADAVATNELSTSELKARMESFLTGRGQKIYPVGLWPLGER